jgi:hypothetical protein
LEHYFDNNGNSNRRPRCMAREVCEGINSQRVLSRSVAKIGHHFLITEEASSGVDGTVLAQAKYKSASAEDLPHTSTRWPPQRVGS